MTGFRNIFTVDLEEWFVVEILSGRFSADDWRSLESTVIDNSLSLLDLLKKKKVKATWYTLGWVADEYPDLIQEIFQNGHEIACHSYYHRRVDRLDREGFRRDTQKAVDAIVKAIGDRPYGYRAPSWSISPTIPWAFETLGELGFLYDSSIFPIKHDLYGWPQGPRHIFKVELKQGGTLWEVPATTFRMFGQNMPVGGGGYFRHSPYWYSRRIIKRLNDQGHPAVFYVHPWEIDPSPPHLNHLSPLQKFRSYSSTSIMERKLGKLLDDFSFTTVADYLNLFKKRRIGFQW